MQARWYLSSTRARAAMVLSIVLGLVGALYAVQIEGKNAGAQKEIVADASGNLCVNLAAGSGVTLGNVTPVDPAATSGAISAVDAGTTSTAGIISGQTVLTGTPSANSSVSATLSGDSSFAITITGTWVATLAFEKSADGGATWIAIGLTPTGLTTAVSSVTGTGANSRAVVHGNGAAYSKVRVRCTNYTSGSASVTIQPGAGVGPVPVSQLGSPWGVAGAAAAGSAVSGNPVLMAGSDGTNARTLVTDSSGNQVAVGNVGSGVADSGNPVKIGGVINTSIPAAGTTGNRGDVWLGANRQVMVSQLTTGQAVDAASNRACSDPAGNNVITSAGAFGFNGANWDRWRNNVDVTLLADAVRTATTSSADQTNFNGRGVLVYLNVVAASGTGGLTVQIQAKDPVSGSYKQINGSATAITATGITLYQLYPGNSIAPGAVGGNTSQNTCLALPRTWRVTISHGDASNYEYSVGASVIN